MLSQWAKTVVSFSKRNICLADLAGRHYGTRRTVVDYFETEEDYLKSLEAKNNARKRRPAKTEPKSAISKENQEHDDNEEFRLYSDVPKEILGLKYTKPNPANVGNFSRIMMNMKSRSYRDRHGACLLEGKFLINDAMNSGMFVRTVYFSRLQNLVGLSLDILSKTNLVKVKFEEIQQASEVKVQTEGLLAIATKQDEITRKKISKARRDLAHETGEPMLPVTLVCDNVRDAGNLGTLLRSAAAAGCEQVLITKGCVDIWEPKVIRAGAGAHFKIPIEPHLTWEEVSRRMKKYDVRNVFLSHHDTADIKLSDKLPDLDDIDGEPEIHEKLMSEAKMKTEEAVKREEFSNVVFKSLPYYDVTFTNKGHTVIVTGGEVHGVSLDACVFAAQAMTSAKAKTRSFGELINIPMSAGSECLNTAVAGSIILFEARRQLQSKP